MNPGFLRWLSLGFCLLLSWGVLIVPPTLLPQPVLTLQTSAEAEKEAQLQSAEALNKKKSTVLTTTLISGGARPVFLPAQNLLRMPAQTAQRGAQVPKPKILAVPVGRLAPPVAV